MSPQGFYSRAGQNARISAAYDRAAAADRLQRCLEDAGWDVSRIVAADGVTVVLEQPSGIPGLAEEIRFSGPTALDALRLAVSDVLNEAVSE